MLFVFACSILAAHPQDVTLESSNPHAADLALARACAAGDEAAWERFVSEYRPVLYRAAAAIDATGGRDLADEIFADLFGLKTRDGRRQSLFEYFQGRSSLGTWLRAVLAQRHVDRLRARRRLEPLPDDDSGIPVASTAETAAPHADRDRYRAAMQSALAAALAALDSRDRLRVQLYYVKGMKLAAIGRLLHEHEATVSRQLARTRDALRAGIDARLCEEHAMSAAAVDECWRDVMDDPGALDLKRFMESEPA